MNYAFLPDLSALAILIAILLVLRRRHPHKQADAWLLGLFITLVEAVAHTFYARQGMPAKALHIIVLDCYLLAGLAFVWASGPDDGHPRHTRLLNLGLNALPLLAIDTLYGLHIDQPAAFFPVIAAGVLLGVATSLGLLRSWRLALAYTVGWSALAFLVHTLHFREAIYWSLCCVYTLAGLNFQRHLPRRSTGRLAILTGFFIWALCFAAHPWVVHYRDYADIASHVWNMQKSLISIGMLLVMLEQQVAHNQWLALHDELTGLPNRRLFEERFATALRTCHEQDLRLVVFLLDLNGFKKINDSLGHHAGDQVLRALASSLRSGLPAEDTLARLGGDEFVLLTCENAGSDIVSHRTRLIQDALDQPFHIQGRDLFLSASLGQAVFPHDARDASRLLHIADQRMYALKQSLPPSRHVEAFAHLGMLG